MRRLAATFAGAMLLEAGIAATGIATAETIALTAELNSAAEVPPNDSTATGLVEATYDTETGTLTWTTTYSGLSGPAIGIHFHGPAEPGENAGITLPYLFVNSPVKGKATLSDAQAEDVLAGKWYTNVHTEAHPGGEIRGQLTR